MSFNFTRLMCSALPLAVLLLTACGEGGSSTSASGGTSASTNGGASASTSGESSGLKPGLWENKQISMVVDGRDMNAQMAAAQAQMQKELAKLTPDERKQMQAMMSKASGGMMSQQGVMRICISPAMATKNNPMLENGCEPVKLSRSGNKTNFEINCTKNGRTTVGKGESTNSNDTVTTRTDMTMTDAQGRHTMQMESQMKYLGADCQDVKPADQIIRDAQDHASLK